MGEREKANKIYEILATHLETKEPFTDCVMELKTLFNEAYKQGAREAIGKVLSYATKKYNPNYDGEANCNCDHTINADYINLCERLLAENQPEVRNE